jgi:hypothetical protein
MSAESMASVEFHVELDKGGKHEVGRGEAAMESEDRQCHPRTDQPARQIQRGLQQTKGMAAYRPMRHRRDSGQVGL